MKNIQPLRYGQQLYLFTPNQQYLFGRGFINKNVYLSNEKSSQCVFVLQQKTKNNSTQIKNNEVVNYGTQLLIKNIFSGHYLSIEINDNQPQLILSKQEDQKCYFQLIPKRNFQQNGEVISLNSFFSIQSSYSYFKQFCISSFNFKYRFYDKNQSFLSNSHHSINPTQHLIGKNNQYLKRNNKKQTFSIKSQNFICEKKTFQLKNKEKQRKTQKKQQINDEYQISMIQTNSQSEIQDQAIYKNKQDPNNLQKDFKKKKLFIDQNNMHKDDYINPITIENIDKQVQQQNIDKSIQQIFENPIKSQVFFNLKYFNSNNQSLQKCKIQPNENSFWKVQIKQQQKTQFLSDNDYIQFIYSNKNDGILTLNIQNYPFQVKYQISKGQQEQLFSSIFKVQIQNKKMYLKHILTDLYFPLNSKNQKTQFQINPLSYKQNNQLAVFQIKFNGKIFQPLKGDFNNLINFPLYKIDGFWMNKVQKYPLNEILSFQNVPANIWISYFKSYLKLKGKKGQKILKQVQILQYMIQILLPNLKKINSKQSQNLRQQIYKLLFKSCLFNPSIKRYLIQKYMSEILKQQQKKIINELIIQLLQKGQGLLEKYITSQTISTVIIQMLEYYESSINKYSISYIRLFRIFCGSENNSCKRNQKIIFSYFSYEEQAQNMYSSHMTQSYLGIKRNKNIYVPNCYKYKLIQKDGQILILCDQTQKNIDYFIKKQNQAEKLYLRQYLYLLADTMKNLNQQTINKFTQQYSLKLLITILTNPRREYDFLKGPVLNLIITAFLSREPIYKFYIFYKKYPKLYYKGKLTAQNISSNSKNLLQYIKHEITNSYHHQKLDKDQFNSTTFKHFLFLIKYSIECGFWSDQNQLLDTILWLQKIFQFDEEIDSYHQSYQMKLSANNLKHCKTLAVQIYTLYVDLQINMCISELLQQSEHTLANKNIMNMIQQFYYKSCHWNIHKFIFKICSTSNSQLMKQSLFLFQKIYNLKQIVENQFNQAKKQLKQQTQFMQNRIDFLINNNNIQYILSSQQQIEKYLQAAFKNKQKNSDEKYQQSNSFNGKTAMLKKIKNMIFQEQNCTIQNIFRYEKPNEQFQMLAYKLGIHNKIIQNIMNFLNQRKKQQNLTKKQILSNQLFLLLALIKQNEDLKLIISQYRALFINLLYEEDQLYYVSCEILLQIYKENRKLVFSDTKNLENICLCIKETFKKGINYLQNKLEFHHISNIKSKDGISNVEYSLINTINNLKNIQKKQQPRKSSLQMPYIEFNKCQSYQSKFDRNQNNESSYQSLALDNANLQHNKINRKSRKKSIYNNLQIIKKIRLKECKLLQLLLVFVKVKNQKIQKNQKIILRHVLSQDNLTLIGQKIIQMQNQQNLANIFKILIYHLLQQLEKNPQKIINSIIPNKVNFQHASTFQKSILNFDDSIIQRTKQIDNDKYNLIISQHSLNNLLMSIGRNNWQIKSIIYKFISKNLSNFKISGLKEFLRLTQVDLNFICQLINQGQIFQNDQSFQINQQKNNIQTILKGRIIYKKQILIFRKCCVNLINCILKISSVLLNQSKIIDYQLIKLLIINIQRLFLLRNILPINSVKIIETKLFEILNHIFTKKSFDSQDLKKIDLNNLFKIQIDDWSLSQLKSQKFRNLPLISELDLQKYEQIRQRQIYMKNTELQNQIMKYNQSMIENNDDRIMKQNKISSSVTILFPPKQQILKKFLSNLIKVNSTDCNVLSDQLKSFLIVYMSYSFLQKQRNNNHYNRNLDLIHQNINNQDFINQKSNQIIQLLPEEQYQKKQNLLIDYDVPLVICSILEEGFKSRYNLFSNVFQLANQLLEGGNTKGQDKFLEAFRNDHKNIIFQNISLLIKEILETIEFYYNNNNIISENNYLNQTYSQYHNTQYECRIVCKLLCQVFRFLQLLCQNNHRKMKSYIFSQSDQHEKIKYLSVNFVHIAIEMFKQVIQIIQKCISIISKKYSKKLIKQIKQNLFLIPLHILDFLIEVCQIPAFENQMYLCKTDFFNVLQNLSNLSNFNHKFITLVANQNQKLNKQQNQFSLNKMFYISSESFQLNDNNILFAYQKKMLILFRSLLQQQNPQIISEMSKNLSNKEFQYFINQALLHGGLQDIQKLRIFLAELTLNHHIQTIVNVLIVKKILLINQELNFSGIKKQIILSLQRRIQSIKINFQGQNLTVYFPYHPLFQLLTQKTKKFFLDRSINFKSRNQKLLDFIISRNVIYQDIQNGKNLQKKLINDKNMQRIFHLSIGISYLIISLLLIFYSVSKSGTVLDLTQSKIISGINLMHLIVTIIYFIVWGVNITPLTRQKLRTKKIQVIKINNQNDKLMSQKQVSKLQVFTRKIQIKRYIENYRNNLLFLKEIYLQQSSSFHVILLLLISLIGFFIEVRIHSLALIFFFTKIQLLQSIFKAIKLTWKQLFIVSSLAVVFSFIFGFITINNYINPLYENQQIEIDINRINNHCNSILSCIKSLYTLKIIGQSVNQDGNQQQFLSDLIYWGFFDILLTNIIAAIIIDKFAQQRNAKQKIQNQRHNRCYICSADKSTLQRKQIDFNKHVSHTHYLWNYFYYMYTLQKLKDHTQFTGLQYWLEFQIKNNQIEWIPLDQSKRSDVTQKKIDLIFKLLTKNLQKNQQNQIYFGKNMEYVQKSI